MATQVYLIHGDDEYRVSEKARRLVDTLVPPADRTLGLEIIEGRCDTTAEAEQALSRTLEAIRTVGFLASSKTVWLRDGNFFADVPASRSDGVKARIAALNDEIKAGLPAGQTLLITSPKVDGRSALAKTCAKLGEVSEFSVPDKGYLAEQHAGKTLASYLGRMKLTMPEDVQALFLEKVGVDTRQIVNELEKLCAYMGDRRDVEAADIEAVTSSSRTSLSWDLADAFGKRDLPRSLLLVRRLLFGKESPVGLIITLDARIRDLMIYREALDRGWVRSGRNVHWNVPEDVAVLFSEAFERDPRQTHPFRAGLLAQQAQGFTRPELVRALRATQEAYKKLVSGSIPRDLTLEVLLLRLLAFSRKP